MEEEIMIESTRTMEKAPRGADDWSVVHAPSQEEAIEMTGALDVVEVQPRQVPVDEVEVGRVAQHVTEPEEMRNDRWTEITKKLIVREAIERMGFEYEETRTSYYIFSFLKSVCIIRKDWLLGY
jgi:translation elongation factor EF-1alpha